MPGDTVALTPENLTALAGTLHDVLHADWIDIRLVLDAARLSCYTATVLRTSDAAPFMVGFFEARCGDLIDKAIGMLDAGESLLWLDGPSPEIH